VMAALSPRSWLHRLRLPGADALALWSYSIYLSHKAVGHVLQGVAQQQAWPPALAFALVLLASVAVGAAMYHLIERPIIALRDRRFSGCFIAKPRAWCPPASTAGP